MESSGFITAMNMQVTQGIKLLLKKKEVLSPENAQISTYDNYNNDDFTSVRQTVLICKRLSIWQLLVLTYRLAAGRFNL